MESRIDIQFRDIYDIVSEVVHELSMEYKDELEELLNQNIEMLEMDSSMSKNESIEQSSDAIDPVTDPEIPIEQRIHHFETYYLTGPKADHEKCKHLFKHSLGNFRRILKINQVLQIAEISLPLHHLLIFSPFWVRDPLTWCESHSMDMFDHLFSIYPAPEGFKGEWYKCRNTVNRKWLYWHLILMQGGSLKRASKLFNWNIFSKFQHYLSELDHEHTFEQYVSYTEVLRICQNKKMARAISMNSAFAIDITDPSLETALLKFWYETVHWCANHYSKIGDNDALILLWAMHKYTEAIQENKHFSWKGRSPNNVIALSREYQSKREFTEDQYHWNSHDLDWNYQQDPLHHWTIHEITSASELYLEGIEMQHCVAIYLEKCLNEVSAIFTMKYNQKRVATIELDCSKRQVVQAYGPANSTLTQLQRDILKKWVKEVVEPVAEKKNELLSPKTLQLLQEFNLTTLYSYTDEGNTLLHEMVKSGETEDVELLLQDVKPDITNKHNEIPLMIAVKENRVEMVRILMKAKPAHSMLNYPPDSIIYEAFARGNRKILDELLESRSIMNPVIIYMASTLECSTTLSYLQNRGADMNASDSIGRTALFFAIKNKDVRSIRRLNALGAKLDLMSYLEAEKSCNSEIRSLTAKKDPIHFPGSEERGRVC